MNSTSRPSGQGFGSRGDHPHHKRVVNREVLRRPTFTPEQLLRAERRKQALGLTDEDIKVWNDPRRLLSFAAAGAHKITRADLLCYNDAQIASIAFEASEARKELARLIDQNKECIKAASSPVAIENLERLTGTNQFWLSTYASFSFACDAVKQCTAASLEVAREQLKSEYEEFAAIRKENRTLRRKLARMEEKQSATNTPPIPLMPSANTAPRDVADLWGIVNAYGDDAVVDMMTVDEYNAILDSIDAHESYLDMQMVDWSMAEDSLRKHEREAAIERFGDRRFALEQKQAEYQRLEHLFASKAADTEREIKEQFDADRRQQIRAQVIHFLRSDQEKVKTPGVSTTHKALGQRFSLAAHHGKWSYINGEQQLCIDGKTTRFKDQLSVVLEQMVDSGDLRRLKPHGHQVVATRWF